MVFGDATLRSPLHEPRIGIDGHPFGTALKQIGDGNTIGIDRVRVIGIGLVDVGKFHGRRFKGRSQIGRRGGQEAGNEVGGHVIRREQSNGLGRR